MDVTVYNRGNLDMPSVLRLCNLEVPVDSRIGATEQKILSWQYAGNDLAKGALNLITSYADAEVMVQNIERDGLCLLLPYIDKMLADLVQRGCVDYDRDKILMEMEKWGFLYNWTSAVETIQERYQEIVGGEEAKDAYRTMRRQGRGHMIGGGFGFGGAVKGAAMAGSVNLTSNVAHGTFNLLAKGVSAIGAHYQLTELKDGLETQQLLSEGLLSMAWSLGMTHCNLLRRHSFEDILTHEEREANNDASETCLKLSSNTELSWEQRFQLIGQSIGLAPYREEAHHAMLNAVLERSEDLKKDITALSAFSAYYGVQLDSQLQQTFATKIKVLCSDNNIDVAAAHLQASQFADALNIDLRSYVTAQCREALFPCFKEISEKMIYKEKFLLEQHEKFGEATARYLAVGNVRPRDFADEIAKTATEDEIVCASLTCELIVKTSLEGKNSRLQASEDPFVELAYSLLRKDQIEKNLLDFESKLIAGEKNSSTDAAIKYLAVRGSQLGIDVDQLQQKALEAEGKRKIEVVLQRMRPDYPGLNDDKFLAEIEEIARAHGVTTDRDYSAHVASLREVDKRECLAAMKIAIEELVQDERGKNTKQEAKNHDVLKRAIKYTDGTTNYDEICKTVQSRREQRIRVNLKEFRERVHQLESDMETAGFIKKQEIKLRLWNARKIYDAYKLGLSTNLLVPELPQVETLLLEISDPESPASDSRNDTTKK